MAGCSFCVAKSHSGTGRGSTDREKHQTRRIYNIPIEKRRALLYNDLAKDSL